MKRPSSPDATALFLILDLRAQISPILGLLAADPEPSGRMFSDPQHPPAGPSLLPELPPPRLLQVV